MCEYYREAGRRFPWRASSDPFAVAIAEVLLTKTKADAVEGTWKAFLRKYPTAEILAQADAHELQDMLRPLGLWEKRARHLVQLGRYLSIEGLTVLSSRRSGVRVPGLGTYAAAAVACFAFGERVGIVDGNVRRILTRFFGVRHPKTQRGNIRRISALADAVAMASPDAGMANYGLLDLAAATCKPRPACGACLLKPKCKLGGSMKKGPLAGR